MRPRSPEGGPSDDLFRAQLSNQLDGNHPLVRLAGLIETRGRPGKPTRLMVGLIYLKHSYNLSDGQVCYRALRALKFVRALAGEPVLAVLLWFRLPAASAAD